MYRFVHHTAELEVGLEAETAQGVLLEELPTSRFHGHELRPELESRGIVVPSPSAKGLAEEARSPTRTSTGSSASSSVPVSHSGSPVSSRSAS